MSRFLAASLVAVAASACGSPTSPVQPITTSPLSSIRQSSGLRTAQNIIVSDAATWASVWASAWSNIGQPPALPNVDFNVNTVLVAAMGDQPTGGYAISIGAASLHNGTVTVSVTKQTPMVGCVVTDQRTSPIDAVTIPKQDPSTISFDVFQFATGCS